VTRADASSVSLSKGFNGQVLQAPRIGVVRIIHEHVDVRVVRLGNIEGDVDVHSGILVCHLIPWKPTDDVGAKGHRLTHELLRSRVP